jgi:hypothetical protein
MSPIPEIVTFDPEGEDPRPSEFVFGLSLGSAGDRTALTVVEKSWTGGGASRLDVLDCRRWPPRTGYPVIVAAVGRVLALPASRPFLDIMYPQRARGQVQRFHAPAPRLSIDGTQVGAGVVEMFLNAGLAGDVAAFKITGGTEASEQRWPGRSEVAYWSVARIALVSAVQSALQGGRLLFAQQMGERSTLIAELANFAGKAVARNNETFVAEREGDKDDVVLSMALAVWTADRPEPGVGTWGGDPLGDDWW